MELKELMNIGLKRREAAAKSSAEVALELARRSEAVKQQAQMIAKSHKVAVERLLLVDKAVFGDKPPKYARIFLGYDPAGAKYSATIGADTIQFLFAESGGEERVIHRHESFRTLMSHQLEFGETIELGNGEVQWCNGAEGNTTVQEMLVEEINARVVDLGSTSKTLWNAVANSGLNPAFAARAAELQQA